MSSNVETIRRVTWCKTLSEPAVLALASIAISVERKAGEFLFFEGDAAPGIFLVAEGRVKISRTSVGGREQVLHVIDAGEHFNSVPVFDGGTCPANAETLTAVKLVLLPQEALWATAQRYSEIALALLAECGGFLRRLVNLVDDLALHTVQGRLAGMLLAQARAAEQGQPIVGLSHAEMAARIGTVREMVSRTLKTFEGLGILQVTRGMIAITNRAALEELAEE